MSNKDNPQAYRFFKKGWEYEQGNGVEVNIKRALEYYLKAADLGSEIASNRLKTLKARGYTTELKQDKVEQEQKLLIVNEHENNMPLVNLKNGNYQKYYNEVEKKINDIKNNSNKIYYVNAGRMNHGKSSVFNSLANKKEMFATGDIRTTRKQKEIKFTSDIYFIDTPGLAAAKDDDMEAYAAYKKADMILFVHTLKVGELHQDEIDTINKIANLFYRKDEFWKRFCLIFTFKEEFDDEEYEQIKNKSIKDIKKYCGSERFPVFAVSNQDYWQGIEEKDSDLIAFSGITELKNFLMEKAIKLRTTSHQLRKEKIDAIINKALQDLRAEKNNIENQNDKRIKSVEKQRDKAKMKIRGLEQDKWKYEREIERLKAKVETFTSELAQLKNAHEQDKANY